MSRTRFAALYALAWTPLRKQPFDILAGSDMLRRQIRRRARGRDRGELGLEDEREFERVRKKFLMY